MGAEILLHSVKYANPPAAGNLQATVRYRLRNASDIDANYIVVGTNFLLNAYGVFVNPNDTSQLAPVVIADLAYETYYYVQVITACGNYSGVFYTGLTPTTTLPPTTTIPGTTTTHTTTVPPTTTTTSTTTHTTTTTTVPPPTTTTTTTFPPNALRITYTNNKFIHIQVYLGNHNSSPTELIYDGDYTGPVFTTIPSLPAVNANILLIISDTSDIFLSANCNGNPPDTLGDTTANWAGINGDVEIGFVTGTGSGLTGPALHAVDFYAAGAGSTLNQNIKMVYSVDAGATWKAIGFGKPLVGAGSNANATYIGTINIPDTAELRVGVLKLSDGSNIEHGAYNISFNSACGKTGSVSLGAINADASFYRWIATDGSGNPVGC